MLARRDRSARVVVDRDPLATAGREAHLLECGPAQLFRRVDGLLGEPVRRPDPVVHILKQRPGRGGVVLNAVLTCLLEGQLPPSPVVGNRPGRRVRPAQLSPIPRFLRPPILSGAKGLEALVEVVDDAAARADEAARRLCDTVPGPQRPAGRCTSMDAEVVRDGPQAVAVVVAISVVDGPRSVHPQLAGPAAVEIERDIRTELFHE